jgi:CRP/FNR family transcriptional regulator, cyclic AMP receptor protein
MRKVNLFAHSSETVGYDAGQTIFETGDPGDFMYVVQEGELDILIGGRVVETVGEGGVVGELAVIDNIPRSATVVARTAAKVVPIDKKRFLFLLQNTPNFASQVMQIMAERLRAMDTEAKSTEE